MRRPRRWQLPALSRVDLLTGAGLLVLLALSARLYALTIQQHSQLALKAERRSQRVEIHSGRRGRILDRKGRPLAIDRRVTDIAVSLPDLDPTLSLVVPLARACKISRVAALRILRRARAAAARLKEERCVLAILPLSEASRVRRIARRRAHLSVEPAPDGLHLTTSATVLRVRSRVLARLAKFLERPLPELLKKVRERVDYIHTFAKRGERHEGWLQPLPLVKAASFDLIARVRERAFELIGLRLVERFKRRYPQKDVAVHVIGYMRGPTRGEARRDRKAGIVLATVEDALVLLKAAGGNQLDRRTRLRDEGYGRVGVERHHDGDLRGVPGARLVVRDVKNRVRRTLRNLTPKDGVDLELTLDLDLQRASEKAIDEAILRHGDGRAGGAAVLIDLAEGDILALASGPRFDANTLGKHYKRIAKDPRSPQRHRALQPLPPASTWKVLNAFAAFDPNLDTSLEQGWTTVCRGSLRLGKSSFRCEGRHGRIGLVRALERSCNVFFFAAADRIGLSPLASWATRVGLGRPVGLDVGGEYRGLIPHPTYKTERFDRQSRSVKAWWRQVLAARYERPYVAGRLTRAMQRWKHAVFWQRRFASDQKVHKGEIRNTIIGQGDVLATPLQVALVAALVATGGTPALPRLLRRTTPRRLQLELDPDILSQVRRGMRRVVTHGTASRRQVGLNGLDVAGKTGTAERRKGDHYVAWFMGYYPASAPEVAFAVVVDRTRGHGASVCGPVARAMLAAYEQARGGRLR